ncbi:MAG TPA: hypothetical protein VEI80_06495 [Candidatus Acidoferrales bacterium]|nr:hypothetical protein [Candidatus Acidoferrales bacterium]
MKLKTRDLAVALVLMVGLLAAVMATNFPPNLAIAEATCGVNGCVSTPPLSSSTTYDYTGTSVFTLTSTSTTISTSFSTSTTSTTATTTSTFFSYTSTISTTITTTSYSTSYTATQSSSNTFVSTIPTTTTSYSAYTNIVTQKGISTNCPVSTVTNGNRLQEYAQFLRNFRDNQIQNTTAGRIFLTTFNAWYYSWAPALAYSAATNPFVYRIVQAGVVPLIGILYASYYSYTLVAPLSPEAGAITAGVVAASLIGLAYVAPLTYLTSRLLRRRVRLNLSSRSLAPTTVWLTISVFVMVAAYAGSSTAALAFGTVNLVLAALSAGSLAGTKVLSMISLPSANPAAVALLRRYTKTLP